MQEGHACYGYELFGTSILALYFFRSVENSCFLGLHILVLEVNLSTIIYL